MIQATTFNVNTQEVTLGRLTDAVVDSRRIQELRIADNMNDRPIDEWDGRCHAFNDYGP